MNECLAKTKRPFFYTLLLTFLTLAQIASANFEIIPDKAQIPILTPAFNDRQTLKIRLNNGLQAYLVSDPNVDKSSAALTVKTGSWEDPEDSPGIAHFLEHMLFLGTKKYPNEAHYCRFITENGGVYNAFTSNDATSYMFSIGNSAFAGGLDCFSNFFKEPLFNPSGVDRELQAIDQEYAKNVESDDIREYYVLKELGNPKHPNHGFNMGNRNSLSKVSQNTLKKWYREHYSANRMRLVVISNLPIEQIKELVINDFSDIPNSNLPPLSVPLPLYTDSLKGHMVYIDPIMNVRKITLMWELPPQFADMRDSKPDQILGFVLGHEGKKSLLAQLKKEKLAEALAAGGSKVGDRNTVFYIEITLTDAGVKKVDEVIKHSFEAINNFKKKGPQQYLFDELNKLETINYQYQPREDAFEHIMKEARWIANEDLETYPEQSFITQNYNPKAVEEILAQLTPQNAIFSLVAPENLTGVSFEHSEKWLDVSYTVKPIDKQLLQSWANAAPNPLIDLPEINPFVPETLNLTTPLPQPLPPPSHKLPTPLLIHDSPAGKVFFAKDETYFVPQIFWTFEIQTPSINASSAESIVLADLFTTSILDSLSAYTYPASLAGLGFEIHPTDNGLTITIEGYSDKARVLFFDLLKGIKDFRPTQNKFKTLKKQLQREYQNAALDKPLSQASELFQDIIYKYFVTEKQRAAIIPKITFEKFEEFAANLFSKTYVEGTLYGNLTEDQAKEITQQLFATLDSQEYPPSAHLSKEILTLPHDKGPFYLEATTEAQGNAAILALEIVPYSFRARAAQQILMQAMREPFFSTLRTKQQTGYIVTSQADEFELHLFNTFAVQSNTHTPQDLLARFELFIEGFLQEMSKSEISLDRFENIKRGLIVSIRPPPKSVSEMGASLNRLAFKYGADFQWLDKRIKALEELNYVDFLEIASEMLGKNNKRRLAVLLKGEIPEEGTLQYTRLNNVAQFHKLGTYEPAMEMLPKNKESK